MIKLMSWLTWTSKANTQRRSGPSWRRSGFAKREMLTWRRRLNKKSDRSRGTGNIYLTFKKIAGT